MESFPPVDCKIDFNRRNAWDSLGISSVRLFFREI